MEKLKELENYIALQMFYLKNAVSETKRDAAKEFKALYTNVIGE